MSCPEQEVTCTGSMQIRGWAARYCASDAHDVAPVSNSAYTTFRLQWFLGCKAKPY